MIACYFEELYIIMIRQGGGLFIGNHMFRVGEYEIKTLIYEKSKRKQMYTY